MEIKVDRNIGRLIRLLKDYHDSVFTMGKYSHSIFGQAAILIETLICERAEILRYVPRECSTCKHWVRSEPGRCKCVAPEELGPCDLPERQIWEWDRDMEYRNVPSHNITGIRDGKWERRDDGHGNVLYFCSACGSTWRISDGTPEGLFMRFCPRCGARMQFGEGNE